jgi:hypothetical protein
MYEIRIAATAIEVSVAGFCRANRRRVETSAYLLCAPEADSWDHDMGNSYLGDVTSMRCCAVTAIPKCHHFVFPLVTLVEKSVRRK